METRLELHEELRDVTGSDNLYFQPPATIKMKYPCLVYELEAKTIRKADNIKYSSMNRYSVTWMDKNPDTEIPDAILDHFPYSRFDRFFKSDNINHFVIVLYF